MKRAFALFASIALVACATSTLPPDDGVIVGGGVEAGDEGNPYGSTDEAGIDSGDPMTDSGTGQEAAATDTGTPTDSGATDTGTVTMAGVCAKTSLQQIEYAADLLSGGGTDCSGSVSACASGECCYQSSLISLCVTE